MNRTRYPAAVQRTNDGKQFDRTIEYARRLIRATYEAFTDDVNEVVLTEEEAREFLAKSQEVDAK